MKTDEWIVGVLVMGGGRTACSCEVFQGWMPELGISTANFFNCIDLFQFYFSVSLMWALFFFTCLIILQTHRAHLCDTSLCCVWNNLFPLFWRLSFFSKRSICGSHGLLVFMTLPGPVLLLFFFPRTNTHTQWALTADTQLHSLLQLHLLSPWRPCLRLNPPCSQTRTHSL